MARQRRVSIVILTFNNLSYTQECIDAILRHTTNYEIVVVDNASTDGTVEYLRHLCLRHRNVRTVLNLTNRGFAGGCNQGVQAAGYETVCLLNNDTVPLPGWLDAMRAGLAPGVGIVGAKLLFPDMTLQHCGIQFEHRMDPAPHFWPYHRFMFYPEEILEANVCEAVPAVTGACLLTTKQVWSMVGGMDEGYVIANFEDVDFNFAVSARGLRVVYQPKARLIHYWGATMRASNSTHRAADHFGANFSRFTRKWYPLLRGASTGRR